MESLSFVVVGLSKICNLAKTCLFHPGTENANTTKITNPTKREIPTLRTSMGM